MPPEPSSQDTRLEELRQYFASLGRPGRREGPDVEERTAPQGRRGRNLLTALAVVVALVVGLVLGTFVRSGQAKGDTGAGRSAATAAPSRACAQAVSEADQSLAIADRIDEAMAEHTRIMNDLLAGRITGRQALDKGMPSLMRGAADSDRLRLALTEYRAAAQRCRRAA